ncbi:hypothetical protein B0I35DRAFT_445883 [Stachybotrys elegans]|uniref:DUF6536 domain-containing protein n=1 Tax=Stachybotrys elegans TaxID=80388 RepID=A0A8K0SH59_9HYPO|nr:hypothetical protein B0I35DRAFT_445883 [Stachybotrys elegans]
MTADAEQRPDSRLLPGSKDLSRIRKLKARFGAWRVTVSLGVLTACLVLAANVALAVWTVQHSAGYESGTSIVFEGSCEDSEQATKWPHLAINFLSTLLLGASNNCAQILVAPTRQDVDKAHAKGRWLDIGVPSVRNIRHIPSWRSILCLFLFLSSVPLHMVYNSVILQGISWIEYDAILVTEDFVKGGSLGNYYMNWATGKTLQASAVAKNLTRLENAECLQIFGQEMYQTSWSALVVVTSTSSTDGSLANEFGPGLDGGLCGDSQSYRCNVLNDNGVTTWTLENMPLCHWAGCNSPPKVSIAYCLAQHVHPRCAIYVSLTLLYVVIAFNLTKICCLVLALFGHKSLPLLTVGDAIASFLNHPDPATANTGPISKNIFQEKTRQFAVPVGHTFRSTPHHWANAISKSRWVTCMALCAILWCSGAALLVPAGRTHTLSFKESFSGSPTEQIYLPNGISFILAVLLSNTPQILVSFVYLFYNNIFTCMVLAYEYGRFASTCKPLRVSQPCLYGYQRSSFWLQLPYHYIIPMMVTTTFLHWTISRSLYIIQLTVYYANMSRNDEYSYDGLGYSFYAIVVSLCLGGAMILALLGLSRRKLHPGIPVAASCSLAISAATHAAQNELDAAVLPIQYGVVISSGEEEEGRTQIGFSSRLVESLVDGKVYR